MVPDTFGSYFATMAAVGGTLVGLIFIAISINPEMTVASNALLAQRAKVASSFTALLNPLIISLFALIPHETLGDVVLTVGLVDFVNSLAMAPSLLQHRINRVDTLRRAILFLGGLVIYGFEIYYAIGLLLTPKNSAIISSLATLMIVIYILGILRAWEVVGAPKFRLYDRVTGELLKRGMENMKRTSETSGDVAPASEVHADAPETH
ncbi:MAG TPA: hypothetical protein VHZ51_24940 [Ktedonobacteraceae bacterium]|jgi:hypothetical protein|nr:hypothetical protein [Ktedonobacteraceae bacterium]